MLFNLMYILLHNIYYILLKKIDDIYLNLG